MVEKNNLAGTDIGAAATFGQADADCRVKVNGFVVIVTPPNKTMYHLVADNLRDTNIRNIYKWEAQRGRWMGTQNVSRALQRSVHSNPSAT